MDECQVYFVLRKVIAFKRLAPQTDSFCDVYGYCARHKKSALLGLLEFSTEEQG